MRRLIVFGGVAAAMVAIACSDSTAAPKAESTKQWSGAVIEVAKTNPNAHGELRGIVIDSTESLDPTKATPIAGATVVLNLEVVVHPNGLDDTASTTVTKVGEVVTDAQGRFLVTSIAEGSYYLVATPPAGSKYYGNSTWAFVSSGSTQADAVIYLPRQLPAPPVDTLPKGPDDPPPPSSPPPSDTLTTPPPIAPPTQPAPPDSM
jgi:hypothetical protein